jgi:hypothetical protein
MDRCAPYFRTGFAVSYIDYKDIAIFFVVTPDPLAKAFEAGVAAEIDNIAMDESFLNSEIVMHPEKASL